VFKEFLKMVELIALSSRSDRAIATFLYFYVSHGNAERFVRGGKIIIFILQITNSEIIVKIG